MTDHDAQETPLYNIEEGNKQLERESNAMAIVFAGGFIVFALTLMVLMAFCSPQLPHTMPAIHP